MKEDKLDQIQMCFIIGMGRSGTTLLTNLLGQHEELAAMPENNFILFGKDLINNTGKKLIDNFHLLHRLKHNHSLSIWEPNLTFLKNIDKEKATYQNLCKMTYLEACTEEKQKTVQIIVDKNPIYSLYINEIKEIFPKAKFIVISRDPRDNFISRKKHTKGIVSNWNTSLANAWSLYYKSILKHTKEAPDDFHFLRYEDLAAEPVHEMNKIQRFLKVNNLQELKKPAIEGLLNSLEQSNLKPLAKEKISNMHSRLNENVNTKKVGIWTNELTYSELWHINFFCSSIATRLGYQINPPKSSPRKVLLFLIVCLQYPIHLFTHWIYFLVYYRVSFKLKQHIFK